jgi:hypothetical protein
MRKNVLLAVTGFAMAMAGSAVQAQVPLSDYVDANGFLNVQTLSCAQLAGTFQPDADALTAWYSGWYNGLAHKHFLDFRKAKETEHEVIMYCKEHPEIRIIDAIAVVFRDERARLGIEMK